MASHKKSILIIEDELQIAKVESIYLRKAGFDIAIARDGQEGLERFRSLQPDLVVLDLNLPQMDGVDVCKAIREESHVPVVMVTARTEVQDELAGLGFGADDYIKKPFDPKVLVARIQVQLKGVSKKLRFKNVIIDPDTLTISIDDSTITLTAKQFDVLYVLASQPGKIFTRAQILDRLSSESHEVYDRTVDVHIRNIRSAINNETGNDDLTKQLIKTISGKGYRFEPNT